MTAPVLEVHHPDDEILAAFVDNRASEETREKVIAHMAACTECRDLVVMTSDIVAEETNVVPMRKSAGRWIAPLAAAAAITGVLLIPGVQELIVGSKPETLIEPAGALTKRSTAARTSLPVPYKQHDVMRGGTEQENGDALVMSRLGDNERAFLPNRRTSGLAQLLIAKSRPDFDAAVDDLEKGFDKARASDRDAAALDLAAGLIGRGAFSDIPADHKRAYDLADEVWRRTKSPIAAWNRALALYYLRSPEATAAWNEYLKLDPSSEWAKEVRSEYLETEP